MSDAINGFKEWLEEIKTDLNNRHETILTSPSQEWAIQYIPEAISALQAMRDAKECLPEKGGYLDYQKGSSGYELKMLSMGFDVCLDEVQPIVAKLIQKRDDLKNSYLTVKGTTIQEEMQLLQHELVEYEAKITELEQEVERLKKDKDKECHCTIIEVKQEGDE